MFLFGVLIVNKIVFNLLKKSVVRPMGSSANGTFSHYKIKVKVRLWIQNLPGVCVLSIKKSVLSVAVTVSMTCFA
jgi:hypothetical protein